MEGRVSFTYSLVRAQGLAQCWAQRARGICANERYSLCDGETALSAHDNCPGGTGLWLGGVRSAQERASSLESEGIRESSLEVVSGRSKSRDLQG